MLYILIEQYKLSMADTDTALQQMAGSLEKYATNPNADKTRVAITRNQISAINNGLDAAYTLITAYDKFRAENEYLKHQVNNLKAQINNTPTADTWDKEVLRNRSITRVKVIWQDHF
jgi:cell fate (sporulation/competence/biofilm development) regulator YmcA (YheA/YmcA/DUF963 family)